MKKNEKVEETEEEARLRLQGYQDIVENEEVKTCRVCGNAPENLVIEETMDIYRNARGVDSFHIRCPKCSLDMQHPRLNILKRVWNS